MKFTHLDKNKIKMVDISKKKLTFRSAKAKCLIKFPKIVFEKIAKSELEKGEIFNTARCAGIMAAKNTYNIIPLCHSININFIDIDFKTNEKKYVIEVYCDVTANYSTGVEMESLVGCSIASLTIYDMCKSISKKIVIKDMELISKKGGKSDYIKND